MKQYLKLLKFLLPYKGLFSAAVICMGFSAIFDGVTLAMIVPVADKILTNKQIIIPTKVPDFVAHIVNTINRMSPEAMLNYMVYGILVLFVFKGIFNFLQGYLMSDIGQRVVRDIKAKLFAKFQTLSLDYFTQKRGGELISRITNDVKLVENAVSYGSTDIIYQSMQVVIFTVMTFLIYFKLALIVFLVVPFISIPIVQVGKVLRKLSKRSQEKMADTNSLLYENIIGVRIVKAFNMEDSENRKFGKVNQDYYRISMKSIKRMLLLSPITELMGAFAGMAVFFWGGKLVISGKLSFGVFGLFMGSLLSMLRPFKKLSQVNSLNQQAVAASERIHEVLETQPSVVEKANPLILKGFSREITFEHVSFSYGNQTVLRDINVTVYAGQMLAIVGPSGTGKTTLVDLVPRFYDPKQGRILIDGQDIREVSLQSLRQYIGIVTQETILFNDTILANIGYGKPGASMREIESAAEKAYAHDFIMKLPAGYNTFIGDRGMTLSGGERQRIAIARALLKDPPILILDEATSQLDSESERIVQEAIDRLIQGRTVFVIAHRLSTVHNAHRILVIDKGAVVESGTHTELLGKQGLYFKLYNNQGKIK